MIGWLKGEKIEIWKQGSRLGTIISCSGIGYEVQILHRSLELINSSKELILWVHQVQRDDGSSLIGFIDRVERDLFRKLISVNGVGPQLAIALLEQNQAKSLAIEDADDFNDDSIDGDSYGSNIDEVKALLIGVAQDEGSVLETPEPRVRFREFGDYGIRLQLLFWIHLPESKGRTVDIINSKIYKEFSKSNISIPYPTTTVLLSEKQKRH